MSQAETAAVKYVFLDIVGFTKNRSVEAQSDIVKALNQIVSDSLKAHSIPEEKRVLIPTGDGMCIALIEITRPFDIHILLAESILEKLSAHNSNSTHSSRKFSVRVGINENVDNMITDINNRTNVAGSGINMAQRAMSCGDNNHLLISQNVYEVVKSREKYLNQFHHWSAKTKHGESFSVYQMVNKHKTHINQYSPSIFQTSSKPKQDLNLQEIFYIHYAISCESFFEKKRQSGSFHYAATFLLYALSYDAAEKTTASKRAEKYLILDDFESPTLESIYAYYLKQDFHLLAEFHTLFNLSRTETFSEYFDPDEDIFVTDEGKAQFHETYPETLEAPSYPVA